MNKEGKMNIFMALFFFAIVFSVSVLAVKHPNSCSDTDGGNTPWTFGTVSGYFNNVAYSNGDYCQDTSNVFEYFCNGVLKTSQVRNCGTDYNTGNYCLNGDLYYSFVDFYCATGACGTSYTPILVQDCPNNCTTIGNVTGCI